MTTSFREALLLRLAPVHPLRELLPEALEDACRRITERAQNFSPSQELDPITFLSYLADRTEAPKAFLAWPKHPHLADLLLAHRCLQKHPDAIDYLLHQQLPQVLNNSPAAQAEPDLCQQLLADLLVGNLQSPARLIQYRGEGTLLHWLRVVWARRKCNQQRDKQRETSLQPWHLERLVGAENNPELKLLKDQYAVQFKTALTALIEGLPREEKALLNMRFLEGMTLAHIGQIIGLDKGSVSRRFQKIREQLFSRLRTALADSSSEINGALMLLESRLDLSVERLLK